MKNTRSVNDKLLALESLEEILVKTFKPFIYTRNILAGVLFIVITAVMSLSTIPFALLGFRKVADAHMKMWGIISWWLFGLRVRLSGTENMPKGRGFLYVFNHASHLDILSVYGALPRPPRFGAKIELFKIPIFAQAMRAVGTLPIPRGNRAEALQIYADAEERVKKGETFILAPEGTRQSGEEIGPFKSGPFIFAINAKMPIVPLVIFGAYRALPKDQIMPNWGKWKSEIHIRLLPAIETKDLTLLERPALQNQTREAMVKAFDEMARDFRENGL